MRKAILTTIICMWAVPAQALCVGTNFGTLPSPNTFSGSGGEYQVYDPAEYMQSVNFTVTTGASLSCRYYVTLSTGYSGNSAQRQMPRALDGALLNYNVYTNASHNVLNASGSYNDGNVISGSFGVVAVGATNNHTLYWTIAPSQVVQHESSRFEDVNLTMTLYAEFALNVFTPITRTVTFRARAESSVDLSLVDTGGAFDTADTAQTIDFGDLNAGEFLAYDTLIRSNDGYTLSIQSQNAQTLRHADWPSANSSVPYSFSFNGGTVDLSGGGSMALAGSTGLTPATGARFETRFTVGIMSGMERPGLYQDILTVTVAAQ